MNILDFYKMKTISNEYFGFSLPVSKMVVAKCLKLIWNHSGIISGTCFSPFEGSIIDTGAFGGLLSHILASFFLEFWIVFLIFLMNNSIEYSGLFCVNLPDFVLNWIIFRLHWMKKWICKTDWPWLVCPVVKIARNVRNLSQGKKFQCTFCDKMTR